MKVSEPKQEGTTLVLEIEGRLDTVTAPQLETVLNSLADNGHKQVLLDFSKVEYLSSAGMRLLLSFAKKLQGVQGKLVVCSLTGDVDEVIRMAGLHLVLNLCPNRAVGLAAFAT